MLGILGPGRSLASPGHGGVHRREMMRINGLCLAGSLLDSPTASAAGSEKPASTFGRAKNCILLYIYGAWSQLDTFDPKPEAPEEIRGEFGTIGTKLPGVRINELLPGFDRAYSALIGPDRP